MNTAKARVAAIAGNPGNINLIDVAIASNICSYVYCVSKEKKANNG